MPNYDEHDSDEHDPDETEEIRQALSGIYVTGQQFDGFVRRFMLELEREIMGYRRRPAELDDKDRRNA